MRKNLRVEEHCLPKTGIVPSILMRPADGPVSRAYARALREAGVLRGRGFGSAGVSPPISYTPPRGG